MARGSMMYNYFAVGTDRYPADPWAGRWAFFRVDALWVIAFYQGGP